MFNLKWRILQPKTKAPPLGATFHCFSLYFAVFFTHVSLIFHCCSLTQETQARKRWARTQNRWRRRTVLDVRPHPHQPRRTARNGCMKRSSSTGGWLTFIRRWRCWKRARCVRWLWHRRRISGKRRVPHLRIHKINKINEISWKSSFCIQITRTLPISIPILPFPPWHTYPAYIDLYPASISSLPDIHILTCSSRPFSHSISHGSCAFVFKMMNFVSTLMNILCWKWWILRQAADKERS